jgi:hypothetical protein
MSEFSDDVSTGAIIPFGIKWKSCYEWYVYILEGRGRGLFLFIRLETPRVTECSRRNNVCSITIM